VVLSVFLEELMSEGAFEVVVFDLMETIHVELPDEAVHFVVSEVAREDDFLEFFDVLYDEFESVRCPVDDLLILFNLNIQKNTLKI
jgi:hypothetical protein